MAVLDIDGKSLTIDDVCEVSDGKEVRFPSDGKIIETVEKSRKFLEDYIAKKDEILKDYADREKWKRMVATNMANAGFFSSDRTIEEYNKDIWKLR